MNLLELSENIENILIGQDSKSECVAAIIKIDRATKYRGSHLRLAENLDTLLSELYYLYDIDKDDIFKVVIPIAGFTLEDLHNAIK